MKPPASSKPFLSRTHAVLFTPKNAFTKQLRLYHSVKMPEIFFFYCILHFYEFCLKFAHASTKLPTVKLTIQSIKWKNCILIQEKAYEKRENCTLAFKHYFILQPMARRITIITMSIGASSTAQIYNVQCCKGQDSLRDTHKYLVQKNKSKTFLYLFILKEVLFSCKPYCPHVPTWRLRLRLEFEVSWPFCLVIDSTPVAVFLLFQLI